MNILDRPARRARRHRPRRAGGGGAARGVPRRADRLARRREAPRDPRSRHRRRSDRSRSSARRWPAGPTSRGGCASRRYDVAIDLQGLMKSAVLARASGAPRVLGFSIWHLREKSARPFYSETDDGGVRLQPDHDGGVRLSRTSAAQPDPIHVIHKNLRLLRTLGVDDDRDRVSARRGGLRRAARGPGGAGRRAAVRADQSRRRVAEQALAAGSLRRGGGVSARGPASAVGRVVGTGRGSAGSRGRRRIRRRGARLAPPTALARSPRAVARRRR